MRYYPIIQKLKEIYSIDIIVLSSPSTIDHEFDSDINQIIFPKHEAIKSTFLRKLINGVKFISPFHPPIYYIKESDSYFLKNISEAVKHKQYQKIIWAGPDGCELFIKSDIHKYCKDVTYDFIDSPYLLASRADLDIFSLNILKQYERWKTKRMELAARRIAGNSIYISKIDAASTSSDMRHVDVIPNGVFLRDHVETQNSQIQKKSIGFFGDMSYAPNKEAVHLLITVIMPKLLDIAPEINLYLIGKNTIAEKTDLPKNVHITGYVENIWSYINAIDLLVFPIMQGAGLKNKVLEAMYAGKPVITTDIGNEGIDANNGIEIFICNDIYKYPELIAELLNSSATLTKSVGKKARYFTKKHFCWETILDSYINCITKYHP